MVDTKTNSDLPADESVRHRADLFDALQATLAAGDSRYDALLKEEGMRATYPASYAQERLWFLDRLGLMGAAYNMPFALRLEGPLDVAALNRALSELVRRHEVLRTRFEEVNGAPMQVIEAARALPVPLEDLSGLSEPHRQERTEEFIQRERESGFDLRCGPLFRSSLLKQSEREHVLFLTMHHIISDGWSLEVMNRELSALYSAYHQGEVPALEALPVQYADYALWQREWLQGEVLEQQLSYWRERLSGFQTLELPTDRVRPAVASFKGALYRFELPAAVSTGLQRLARQQGVTLYMVLLAAFQVLLSRLSGQQDIVVGSPIAGRTQRELEGLIGFFVNTLVMRTRWQADPSFLEVLSQVKETALGAFEHQDIPFERIVAELQAERDLSRQAVLQVLFAVENLPKNRLQLDQLQWEGVASEHVTAKFDLSLFIHRQMDTLVASFEYATDLFDAQTIERWSGHFKMLLAGIAAQPETRVSELELLSAAQRRQIVETWNETARAYPSERCLHELFAEQAARTPQATAVVYEAQRLTYEELDSRSNQVAHHLRDLGVRPDSAVGLCMERSLEMMVGLLGILKAGGAYVPLDPTHPSERLEYMLEDAEALVSLTMKRLSARLPAERCTLVCLDDPLPELATSDPAVCVHPDQLAYVIYTSGSTGRPKGVGLPHRALVNLLHWHVNTLRVGEHTLQLASVGFDASIHELFSAWLQGREVVIAAEEVRHDVRALAQILEERRIDKAILPVVLFQQLAEQYGQHPQRLRSLRDLMVTGEQLQVSDAIRELFAGLPDCALHNHYGPSETHVVTAYSFSNDSTQWPTHPPIGRPIANTTLYVLDERLNVVPVGVYGELYIGGDNLARGYVNRPGFTAERFIANPFSQAGGERLYRTGDLVRYLACGTLEFVGRRDDQVKIRGYRIEPAEIEGVLLSHPAVGRAVVVALEQQAEKYLAGYVVLKEAQQVSAADLRRYASGMLPSYMVPIMTVLEELPLNANGKVDRKKLPRADWSAGREQQYEAPQTLAEEALCSIWQRVLKVDRVGRRDNFFELGGHSLMAMRVVAGVREIFDIDLPVRAFFGRSTFEDVIGEIAACCGGKSAMEQTVATYVAVMSLSDEAVHRLNRNEATNLPTDAGARNA